MNSSFETMNPGTRNELWGKRTRNENRAIMLSNGPLLWKQGTWCLGAIWETSWTLSRQKRSIHLSVPTPMFKDGSKRYAFTGKRHENRKALGRNVQGRGCYYMLSIIEIYSISQRTKRNTPNRLFHPFIRSVAPGWQGIYLRSADAIVTCRLLYLCWQNRSLDKKQYCAIYYSDERSM